MKTPLETYAEEKRSGQYHPTTLENWPDKIEPKTTVAKVLEPKTAINEDLQPKTTTPESPLGLRPKPTTSRVTYINLTLIILVICYLFYIAIQNNPSTQTQAPSPTRHISSTDPYTQCIKYGHKSACKQFDFSLPSRVSPLTRYKY